MYMQTKASSVNKVTKIIAEAILLLFVSVLKTTKLPNTKVTIAPAFCVLTHTSLLYLDQGRRIPICEFLGNNMLIQLKKMMSKLQKGNRRYILVLIQVR